MTFHRSDRRWREAFSWRTSSSVVHIRNLVKFITLILKRCGANYFPSVCFSPDKPLGLALRLCFPFLDTFFRLLQKAGNLIRLCLDICLNALWHNTTRCRYRGRISSKINSFGTAKVWRFRKIYYSPAFNFNSLAKWKLSFLKKKKKRHKEKSWKNNFGSRIVLIKKLF